MERGASFVGALFTFFFFLVWLKATFGQVVGERVNAIEVRLPTRWAKEVTPLWSSSYPNIPLPEYPRPQMTRDESSWVSLNGGWQWQHYEHLDDPIPFGKKLEKTILVPFPVEATLSGIGLNGTAHMHYRTLFKLGSHRGGYDGFLFDITDNLKRSHATTHELILDIWDPTEFADGVPIGKQRASNPGGIVYSATSGIWQTVWLEAVPDAYITRVDAIPNIDTNSVTVTVEAYFGMRKASTCRDGQGIMRMCLNNKPIFLYGNLDQGYWPDGIYVAPRDEALKSDLLATKAFGFNTVRKHVKVESSRWYYHVDRVGIIIFQDMPSMCGMYEHIGNDSLVNGYKMCWNATMGGNGNHPIPQYAIDQFQLELHRMVEHHYSYPYVYSYEVFNEGWGQYSNSGEVIASVMALDPSRVSDGISGWTNREPFRGGEFGGIGFRSPGHEWDPEHSFAINDPAKQPTVDAWMAVYKGMIEKIAGDIPKGQSAALFTQLTDTEQEVNGLLTYDRINKFDPAAIAKVNQIMYDTFDGVCPAFFPAAQHSRRTGS
ncbi:hypothetical protein WJX73_009065 [Symbiochloris irregularis]|uniref:Uncharacterized protein n=1 Tax=Symbiochloris irregularis TaxID=706552 RepID=A0AAW1PGP4_9CHLO